MAEARVTKAFHQNKYPGTYVINDQRHIFTNWNFGSRMSKNGVGSGSGSDQTKIRIYITLLCWCTMHTAQPLSG